MSDEIVKYNKRGHITYQKYSNNKEYWYKYNGSGNMIYSKKDGNEAWMKYDNSGNMIYYKHLNLCREEWYKYDKNSNRVNITKQEFKQIERTKLLFNNKRINRFSLMYI